MALQYSPPPGMGDEKTLGQVNSWRDDDGYEYTYLRGKEHQLTMYYPKSMTSADPSLHTGPIAELRLRNKPGMKMQGDQPWDGVIDSIMTHPPERRKGHATRILRFAHELAGHYEDFPTPQDSDSRTAAGDAFAQASGMPALPKGKLLSDEQFTGHF